MREARDRLREVLSGDACVPAAPIFDPLSGRIAELQEWPICKLSGSVGKSAQFGLPDQVPMANMTDIVEVSRRILSVAEITLIVDADDCDGGPLQTLRTVRELEAVGVAGIEVEDNAVPPRFGGARHGLVVPVEEQVARLRAAVAARRDPRTVIFARSSVLLLPMDKDEAFRRMKAYADTGVDGIMMPGWPPGGDADIERLHSLTGLPLTILNVPPDRVAAPDFLRDHGVRVRFVPQLPFRAAVQAIDRALAALRTDPDPQTTSLDLAGNDLLSAVAHVPELEAWEQRFSPPDAEARP